MTEKYKVTGSGVEDESGINVTLRLEKEGEVEKEWFPTSPHMPDISCLPDDIEWRARLLWGNYHLPYGERAGHTLWTKKEAIRRHAREVDKLSLEQIDQMMDVFEHGCGESPP